MNTKKKVQIALAVFIFLVLSVGTSLVVDRFLSMRLSRCVECKKSGVYEGHRRMCPAGHIYYDCQSTQVQRHLNCRRGDSPSFHLE